VHKARAARAIALLFRAPFVPVLLTFVLSPDAHSVPSAALARHSLTRAIKSALRRLTSNPSNPNI
jgi:hypothetical protein